MGRGLLDIPQRHPVIQTGGGDERVPECVRADVLVDPGPARRPADGPPGAMPVQAASVCGEEDGAVAAFPGGQVDRPGGARREWKSHGSAATSWTGQRTAASAGGRGSWPSTRQSGWCSAGTSAPRWTIETDPAQTSEVEVRFYAESPTRTRVELEHRHIDRHGRGWEAVTDGVDGPEGWPLYLDRYAALVKEGS
jgi:hypothetical protein